MFDCHAHLTDASFKDQLDECLAEAEAAGVTGIVAVSESLEDASQVLLSVDINVSPSGKTALQPVQNQYSTTFWFRADTASPCSAHAAVQYNTAVLCFIFSVPCSRIAILHYTVFFS